VCQNERHAAPMLSRSMVSQVWGASGAGWCLARVEGTAAPHLLAMVAGVACGRLAIGRQLAQACVVRLFVEMKR
jgi:hypothetical protein